MKRTQLVTALLGALVAAPLWAHHMAEGIISDELWAQIDTNLTESGSLHIEFDPDNPGNLMELDVDDDTGRAIVVSTGIIEFTDDVDSVEAAAIIASDFQPVFEDTIHGMGGIPSGLTDFDTTLVDDDGDGSIEYAVIEIAEPIGQGNSQDLPTEPPSAPPGQRAGG